MTIFAALLGSALGRSLSNELIGNFVVLPEQRVLLCTIDKCANTLLAYAAARVSGISSVHKIGASRDNTYAKVRYTGSAEDVAQLLFDPQANTGWRRAVVLRDPVERFVSAYVSKCLQCNATIGGDGCYNCHSALGLPRRVDRVPTLAETVDALTRIGPRRVRNPHWVPQARFCGGLARNWRAYTHVLPFANVSAGLATLFEGRVPRNRRHGLNQLLSGKETAGLTGGENHNRAMPGHTLRQVSMMPLSLRARLEAFYAEDLALLGDIEAAGRIGAPIGALP